MMRLGYSYWGFLGDNKEDVNGNSLSTPDGNATYSWSIIWEAHRRGWQVYSMHEDRDRPAFKKYGQNNFGAFSQEKRLSAYTNLLQTNGVDLPDLDVLLVEWRFPIPGRNTVEAKGTKDYQPDFERQTQLIEYYSSRSTKIILWDLDYKLDMQDELDIHPTAVFETAVNPRATFEFPGTRTRVEPPTIVSDMLQFKTRSANTFRKAVYIGSRYERDDVITEYIKHASDTWPGSIEFWGNWLKTVGECRKIWPNVSYNDRVTTKDFFNVYSEAVCCPLLAKRDYLKNGFITPRVFEALTFGTIPVGFDEALGINNYVIFSARDGQDFTEIVDHLSKLPLLERDRLRKLNIEKLEFMDARHFVDKIQSI